MTDYKQLKVIRDGALMQMGKGFRACLGLLGKTLADLLADVCISKVRMIVASFQRTS